MVGGFRASCGGIKRKNVVSYFYIGLAVSTRKKKRYDSGAVEFAAASRAGLSFCGVCVISGADCI